MIDHHGNRLQPLFAMLHGGGGGLPMKPSQPAYKFKTAFGSTAPTFGTVSLKDSQPSAAACIASASAASSFDDRSWATVPTNAARFINPPAVVYPEEFGDSARKPRASGAPTLSTAARARPNGSDARSAAMPPAPPPKVAKTVGHDKITSMRRAHAKPRAKGSKQHDAGAGTEAGAGGGAAAGASGAGAETSELVGRAGAAGAEPAEDGDDDGWSGPRCDAKILLSVDDDDLGPTVRVVLAVGGASEREHGAPTAEAAAEAAAEATAEAPAEALAEGGVQHATAAEEQPAETAEESREVRAEDEASSALSVISERNEELGSLIDQMKLRLLSASALSIQMACRAKLRRRQRGSAATA